MRRPMVSHPIGGASLRGLWAVSSPHKHCLGRASLTGGPRRMLADHAPGPGSRTVLLLGCTVCFRVAPSFAYGRRRSSARRRAFFLYIGRRSFSALGGAGSARVRIASGRRFLAGGGVSRKRRAIRLAVPGQPHPVEDFLIPVNGLHPVMNRRRGLDTTRNGVGEATGDAWRDPMQPVTTWKGRCDPQRCRKRVVAGGGHGNRRRISANTGRMSTGRKNKQVRLTPRAAHITPSA